MAIIDLKFCPSSNKLIKNKLLLNYLKNINALKQKITLSCKTAILTEIYGSYVITKAILGLVYAEYYAEIYLDDKEVDKIDDGSNTESEKQLNKLIEKLVKTFEKFDHTTESFSAEKYPTISIIYSIIELLKFKFAVDPNLLLVDDDYNLNNEYELDINSDSEDEKNYTQNILNIQSTIAQGTSMFTGFIATLLDPRLKKMHPWSEELQKETIRICCEK
ncbi:15635_t:CDS:2, partial [Cetraspora pellucida]